MSIFIEVFRPVFLKVSHLASNKEFEISSEEKSQESELGWNLRILLQLQLFQKIGTTLVIITVTARKTGKK